MILNKKFIKNLEVNNKSYKYYDITQIEGIKSIPYSIRVLLEAVIRNSEENNTGSFTEEDIKIISSWSPTNLSQAEFSYIPARVVLQDFTGVPAIVDLASMREALAKEGKNPDLINPLIPCDLVIDHSVQVDYFGTKDSLKKNERKEFERNGQRYRLLKWAQKSFDNMRVVPPSTGIVHQINLEYLSSVVFDNKGTLYPDSCVGTDSHTPMVNGLGVLAWGVGGIEAEAAMLNQPISMLLPEVVGVEVVGNLKEGTTATDLVLTITEKCRELGVVGKFLEFFGEGLDNLSIADRATIANMSPEHGSTVSFFPVDKQTLTYLEQSGRDQDQIKLVEEYYKAQGMFRDESSSSPSYSRVLTIDLSSIEPSLAGPKRPQDRITLSDMGDKYKDSLLAPVGPSGFGLTNSDLERNAEIKCPNGEKEVLEHGSVVIAAITSCTNTSNPSVMIGAGLLAKKAIEKGLNVKPYVKTSLAPGSKVVTDYLKNSDLIDPLEKLGFHVVGYGCTTCIGNSGPIQEPMASAIVDNDLVTSAVLSGNRNFEGRVSPITRSNYLMSPILVVAYALFGTTAKDITTEPLGKDKNGYPIYLKDIWPSSNEIQEVLASLSMNELHKKNYSEVWDGSDAWKEIDADASTQFPWDNKSTYIQNPPYFDILGQTPISSILNARVIGLFADSVTTDHISPAGTIGKNSPAASYLRESGVEDKDFNSYGSRRGNHNIMMRGTFANLRLRNKLTPEKVGNYSVHHPTGTIASFFEVADLYQKENTPLIVIAGKEYGTGSSRDWAAKGPSLQGIKAVIAESYERIHRSNLVGMGIVPLEFKTGDSQESLGLDGSESFEIKLTDDLKPFDEVTVIASKEGSDQTTQFKTICRIDTPIEFDYVRCGGVLSYVLNRYID